MNLEFYKYQGTGNDFIIIDDRDNTFPTIENRIIINKLCDRKFGIGADGLILLQNDNDTDFKMVYYNADGNESTMCGNGGRCIVAFAYKLGIIKNQTSFIAIDGLHEATIKNNWVELKMGDVFGIEKTNEDWVLNTGSPHYIKFVKGIDEIDVFNAGRSIRYNDRFSEEGINVNFIEMKNNLLHVVTYERGVEDETLSCGTGVTAAALIYGHLNPSIESIPIKTKGGNLNVRFKRKAQYSFNEIWLSGSADLVFEGKIKL